MLYSVPYEFIKRKVDVRVTDTVIEIFYNHNRIASHRRLYGRKRQYSTVAEHMPADHQAYLEWNGDRFRKWAERIGTNTCKVVNAILASQRVSNNPTEAVRGFSSWQISILTSGWKQRAERRFPTQLARATRALKTSWQPGRITSIRSLRLPMLHQLRTNTPLLAALTTTGGKDHD